MTLVTFINASKYQHIKHKSEIPQKLQEVTRAENDLAEKMATVKQREEAVAVRESAVSEREETYKETLQKEFFEGIRKNLPQ